VTILPPNPLLGGQEQEGLLLLEDLDGEDPCCCAPASSDNPNAATAPPRARGHASPLTAAPRDDGEPLPPGEARRLWVALWGEGGGPPASGGWQQGLFFAATPPRGLEWGLVQVSGGPCGLLAALQGELLAHLLASRSAGASGGSGGGSCGSPGPAYGRSCAGGQGGGAGRAAVGLSCLDSAPPRPSELREALAAAVATMLWRAAAGEEGSGCAPAAAVVTCGVGPGCAAAALARSLDVRRARSPGELRGIAAAALAGQWGRPGGWGVTLLLMSLALSRGLQGLSRDMDEPGTPLVGPHGHCHFELVALALTGRAVTNAFNGEQRLAGGGSGGGADSIGGGDNEAVLRGIDGRSRVGLLSLHEW
jgi:hypothetical protein